MTSEALLPFIVQDRTHFFAAKKLFVTRALLGSSDQLFIDLLCSFSRSKKSSCSRTDERTSSTENKEHTKYSTDFAFVNHGRSDAAFLPRSPSRRQKSAERGKLFRLFLNQIKSADNTIQHRQSKTADPEEILAEEIPLPRRRYSGGGSAAKFPLKLPLVIHFWCVSAAITLNV